MARKHGPWTINDSKQKYQSELIELIEDEVINPEGKPDTYTIVKIKAGVSVLALDADGFVYLTKEFRYAIGRESIETVNGAQDEGETMLEAAKRELKEEIGIEAEEWTELGTVDPLPSVVDSPAHLFLAGKLTFTQSEQDSAETIQRVKIKFEEAVEMVMQGRITQGTSSVLILKASRMLGK